MPGPDATPQFPSLAPGDGGYESFYLRAVDPKRPCGVWLRHTVLKSPGEPAVGSLWAVVFDADEPGLGQLATGGVRVLGEPLPELDAQRVVLGGQLEVHERSTYTSTRREAP